MNKLIKLGNNNYGGIDMNNNMNVLDEINNGCFMGIDALDIEKSRRS